VFFILFYLKFLVRNFFWFVAKMEIILGEEEDLAKSGYRPDMKYKKILHHLLFKIYSG
jgi:hypothetical protein